MHNVFVSAPAPYGTLALHLEKDDDVLDSLYHSLTLLLPSTLLRECQLRFSSRADDRSSYSWSLVPCVRGGKGGFGSQLRASGGRKKRNETTKSAMADSGGRRLRTLQKAETLAQQLRDLPALEKAARLKKREELMRVLETEPVSTRFDDDEYLNNSEMILKDIKDAMQDALQESVDEEEDSSGSSKDTSKGTSRPRKLQGWDEDEDEDEEVSGDEVCEQTTDTGKGKGKGKQIDQQRPSKRTKHS